jgi:formate C-acetyltransferase
MVRVVESEKSLRDKVITIKPTPRVERLRQRYLDTKDKVVIDMLRIVTKVMKETEGEPIVTRRAKAFAATVRGVPINIYPDELFVGWLWHEPHGTEFAVERGFWMEEELDTLNTREISPFLISDKDKRELREEIFPYWKAHHYSPPVPPELKKAGITGIGASTLYHHVLNYEKVLKKGLLGVKRDAEERLARLDCSDHEEIKKVPFLEGVIMALEAAAEIGERFAARARELAEIEEDATRKAELLKIADVCDRVPAKPARTFYEALQSVWFIHMLLGWDTYFHGGQSPGNVDQYLYPYYESDIKEGRITREEAQELLDCWCMRYSQMFSIMSAEGARYASNHTSVHDITVGGLKPDGTDATNELSYMFIEAVMHTPGMVEPTLILLVHSKTPEDLLIKGCQLTSLGGGYPMFKNQDLMIENLLSRGDLRGPPVTLEMVRKFGTTDGCHHPTLAGMESGWGVGNISGIRLPTLPAALEFVLNNGVRQSDHEKIGLETGDPRQCKSFEEFREAFKKQVVRLVKNYSIAHNIGEIAALQPTVFTAALTEDCIEKGIPREEGGARYNIGSGGSLLGSVDIGNSLAAIKKLVFDEKEITMDQLCQALDNNFEGYENIHKMCLEAPKFGNDDDYVDEQVAWVTHLVTEEAGKYKTIYGGRRFLTLTPLSTFVPAGKVVGALPSGRLAGQPLADALSPTVGSDVKGPTAVLKSVGKVNNAEVSLGSTLNMKLDPSVFEKEDGVKRLAALIRTLVDQKVDQIQINVVSADTLRAAQKKPDEYKDLVVKVAGYNARFVSLHKEIQDSIIARTEHGL